MATVDETILGQYRDKPIKSASARFRRMGDGLAKAMEIEGSIDEPGTLVTFVARCKVGPHKLILSEDEQYYDIDIDYLGGTVAKVDDDLVAEVLNTMERRIREAEEARSKQINMPQVGEAADQPGAGKPKVTPGAEIDDQDKNPNGDSSVPRAADDGGYEGGDLVGAGSSRAKGGKPA